MTKSKKPRVRCTHGNADLTPSGHCRICDRARRQEYHVVQKMRSSAAKEAALARGDRVGPLYEKDESVRVNRILELMDEHWRASTPWERAAIDAEIRRLTRQGGTSLDTGTLLVTVKTPMQHDDQEPLTEPRCEALAAGRRKYRRIEPCPRCGCFVRYTLSAACVECVKKHSKDAYKANRRLLGIG